MATSSYSGNPADSLTDAVRFWIADTSAPYQFTNEEIDYTITLFTNAILAAASLALQLASRYARKPDKRVGDLEIKYSQVAKFYTDLAASLQAMGETFGVRPYAGGTSISDMITVVENTDRPPPPFTLDQFSYLGGVDATDGNQWDDGAG